MIFSVGSLQRSYLEDNWCYMSVSQFSVEDSHGKFTVGEDCEDLTCDLKTLCVLQCTDIWSVTVVVPVLKFIARKSTGKTLQRNSHCLDWLPSND